MKSNSRTESVAAVRWSVWLSGINRVCSMFGCSATLQLSEERPAASGKSLAAGSVGVGAADTQKVATVAFKYGRCQSCPRLQALWHRAINWCNKGEQVLAVSHRETCLSNRHWNIAEVGDGKAIASLSHYAIRADEKSRLNSNPNPVTVESPPSIQDAENSPEKSERRSDDGCN